MSNFYLDASALAKRYLTEIGSTWLQSLVDPGQDNGIIAADITRVEVAAALSARHRAPGGLSQQDRDNAVKLLLQHCNSEYLMIPVNTTILDQALVLTQNYRLRGYDAVQLATALVINAQLVAASLSPLTFVAADTDLLSASSAEGLQTENPNNHP